MAYAWRIGNQAQLKDNVVYFGGETSAQSWAGVIGDENDMTDEEVNRYIKETKPQLFDELRGLKFGSSDIPLTFKPLRDLRRLDNTLAQAKNQARGQSRLAAFLNKYRIAVDLNPAPTPIRDCSSTTYRAPADKDNLRCEPEQPAQMQDQLKLDGVAQSAILGAAERLYPNVTPIESVPADFYDKSVEQESPSDYPTNSKQALDLRALKQLEINESLAEVSKCERALAAAKSQLNKLKARSPSPDASVLITRQPYMEKRDDRYKKQGLTRSDYNKYSRQMRQKDRSGIIAPPKTPQKCLEETQTYYCYCRESADNREMIRCSKEWCPIGWFHLECTGLTRLPYLHEEFYCAYCSDNPRPNAVGKDCVGRFVDESKIRSQLLNSIDEGDLEQIETEVVFGEESPQKIRTKAPGHISIYEDDGGSPDIVIDQAQIANEKARLHNKIMRWKTVNEQSTDEAIEKGAVARDDTPPRRAGSTTSFSQDEECLDSDRENQRPPSSTSTLRIDSSTYPSSDIADSLNEDRQEIALHDSGYYEQEDTDNYDLDKADYEDRTTSVAGSLNDHNGRIFSIADEAAPSISTHSVNPIRTADSDFLSNLNADIRPLIGVQPSTITDTTVRKSYSHLTEFSTLACPRPRAPDYLNISYRNPSAPSASSTLSSAQSNLPPKIASFRRNYNRSSTDAPHTPLLAPCVSTITRSKNPWGTPINVANYTDNAAPALDLIVEPTSPSPVSKRKFSEVNDEQEEEEDTESLQEQQEEEQSANDSDEEAYQEGWGQGEHHNVTKFKLHQSLR